MKAKLRFKHQAGKHSQKTHGRRGGKGGGSSSLGGSKSRFTGTSAIDKQDYNSGIDIAQDALGTQEHSYQIVDALRYQLDVSGTHEREGLRDAMDAIGRGADYDELNAMKL